MNMIRPGPERLPRPGREFIRLNHCLHWDAGTRSAVCVPRIRRDFTGAVLLLLVIGSRLLLSQSKQAQQETTPLSAICKNPKPQKHLQESYTTKPSARNQHKVICQRHVTQSHWQAYTPKPSSRERAVTNLGASSMRAKASARFRRHSAPSARSKPYKIILKREK